MSWQLTMHVLTQGTFNDVEPLARWFKAQFEAGLCPPVPGCSPESGAPPCLPADALACDLAMLAAVSSSGRVGKPSQIAAAVAARAAAAAAAAHGRAPGAPGMPELLILERTCIEGCSYVAVLLDNRLPPTPFLPSPSLSISVHTLCLCACACGCASACACALSC